MRRALYSILFVIGLFFQGCAQPSAAIVPPPATGISSSTPRPTLTFTPPAPPTDASRPSPQPSAAPVELKLWISPAVPGEIAAGLSLPSGVKSVNSREEANLLLDLPVPQPAHIAGEGTYILALVAPFPTVRDGVTAAELKRAWQGKPPRDYKDVPLLLDARTHQILTSWWGKPAPGSTRVVTPDLLLETAWKSAPAWAIVPFDEIEPRWKVLRVDGISPLDRIFNESNYALTVPFQVTGTEEAVQSLRERARGGVSITGNRDPDKLTVLVMTGVTALSRGTAQTMEREGVLYPAWNIRGFLESADLTHISNEVSFADNCLPGRPDARFCSPTRYIELLEAVGTDIVELTGNHNLDWGKDAYNHSLALYEQLGMQVYGGGATPEEARRPLVVEHHGNRLVFLGCNAAGPEGAWAGPYQPGAATCDFDALEEEIEQFVREGYLPVVTLQHIETNNYHPEVAQNMPDFRRLAQAGAVIVSGSQSHYPQTMTFVGRNFVHYGLGNLFFDQMDLLATRQEFVDRHVFYNGRYLGVELLTFLLEDSARPRQMTTSERSDFLEMIFDLCVWKNQ